MKNKNEIDTDGINDHFKDIVYCSLINKDDAKFNNSDKNDNGTFFLSQENRILQIKCKGLLGDCFCILDEDNDSIYKRGDLVIIGCEDSLEIGTVEETGNIVGVKIHKLGIEDDKFPKVKRKATKDDLTRYYKNLETEAKAAPFFKDNAQRLNLNMKLVDIHYQFDRKKLFFFYTSDGRVDFRELARILAQEFKTRIELRQIGVRDEAKRVGGLGTCGREYCCASFLMNFKRITTQIANEQNLSANMAKLSGPCGKLKCCLSFELE